MSQVEKMETDVELIARVRNDLPVSAALLVGGKWWFSVDVVKELCNRLEAAERKVVRDSMYDPFPGEVAAPLAAGVTGEVRGDCPTPVDCGTEWSCQGRCVIKPAPSPATVDVGEAFAVIKNAERHIGMSPDQPGHHEVGGILTLRGLRKVFAAIRSLASALETSEKKAAQLEGRMCLVCGAPEPCKDAPDACTFDPSPIDAARAFLDRATAAEALARETGEALELLYATEPGYSEERCRAIATAEATLAKLRDKGMS